MRWATNPLVWSVAFAVSLLGWLAAEACHPMLFAALVAEEHSATIDEMDRATRAEVAKYEPIDWDDPANQAAARQAFPPAE